MAKIYPFIDIAVLDGVRERMVKGDALCLLTPALDEIIWVNPQGATLFGFGFHQGATGQNPQLSIESKRQIFAAGGRHRAALLFENRSHAPAGMVETCVIALPDGTIGILLIQEGSPVGLHAMISGLAGDTGHVAIIDAEGSVLAESAGFGRLGIDSLELAALAHMLPLEANRLVKRPVPTLRGPLPAGAGLLADSPQAGLLLIIDEQATGATQLPEQNLPAGQPGESAATKEDSAAPPRPLQNADLPKRYFADESDDGSDEPEWFRSRTHTSQPVESSAPGVPPVAVPEVLELARQIMPAATQGDKSEEIFTEREAEGGFIQQLRQEDASVAESGNVPVRFNWRIDRVGRFSSLSPEFAGAVGHKAADIIGRTFSAVAKAFALDEDGEIAGLLERRDTWSGRSVLWPIEGTDLRCPIDLAALPVYGFDRAFDGFRGFGVARLADAVVDPHATGIAMTNADNGNPPPHGQGAHLEKNFRAPVPTQDEKPAPNLVPAAGEQVYQDNKVIRLEERRSAKTEPAALKEQPANRLSASERSAFREIAERLREGEVEKAQIDAKVPDAFTTIEQEPTFDPEVSGLPSDNFWLSPAVEESQDGELPDGAVPETYPNTDSEPAEAAAKYEEMLRDLIETVEKPIETDIATARAGPEIAAASYNAMLRDILITIDEPAIDEKLIRVMPADEILRVAEEHHKLELEEYQSEPDEDSSAVRSTLEDTDELDIAQPVLAGGKAELIAPPAAIDASISSAERRPASDTSILAKLSTPIIIYSGSQIPFANDAFLELTGYGSAAELQILGGVDQLIAGDHAAEGSGQIGMRISGNGVRSFNAVIKSVPWNGSMAMMLTIGEQTFPQRQGVSQPRLSDHEASALAKLRQEADELSSILDTATDGIVILDSGGTIKSLSPSAEVLFGFDALEIVGKPFTLLLATESQRSVADYIAGMSGKGVASIMNDGREVIGREARGRFIPLFMTIGRLQGSDGFCAVLRDMTQWKRAEEQLIEARRAAEEASATKSEFLTRVSHEIRTPLNAIIGFSELMAEERFGPVGNPRYLDYSKDINRSGRHVLDLVNDLLDISKIEAGEQEMNFESVSLNDTLAETVALMQPQANRERVIIRSSFASALPDVVADLRSIKQIALNLLSNAVRYTGAGGQVIMSTAHELNGDVAIRIRDTGIGMSQPDIDQAMKPFKQLNNIKRERGDGTGLGLPLSKAMVEGNRARFSITSTPGSGTLIEITFPASRVLAK